MKTSKPFATISYNTDKFLVQKLDEFVRRDAISFYAYIEHYPEEDEKKKHKHLYIVPNGTIETNSLRKELEEFDFDKLRQNSLTIQDLATFDEKKRKEFILGCLDVRPSKFDDWYLYGIHDTAYLASKGQSRKHHYRESDVKTNSEDSLHERVTTIDFSKFRKTQDFVNSVLSGIDFYDMVRKGQIPAPQFMQWKNLYDFIKQGQAARDGRQTHTPSDHQIDPETGEILYGLPPLPPERNENGQYQIPDVVSPDKKN